MDLSQLKQALDTFANKYFCPPKLKFSHLPSIPEGYLIRVPSSRCCWEFSLSSLPLRQGDKHMLPKLSSSLVPPSAHLLPEAHLTFNPLGILLSGMGHLFHLHRLLKTSHSPHLPPPTSTLHTFASQRIELGWMSKLGYQPEERIKNL